MSWFKEHLNVPGDLSSECEWDEEALKYVRPRLPGTSCSLTSSAPALGTASTSTSTSSMASSTTDYTTTSTGSWDGNSW